MREVVTILPEQVDRKLIVIRGRSGLLYEDFIPVLVANEARFGRDTGNYVNMVQAHEFNTTGRILGIHEEIRRRLQLVINSEQVEFQATNPFVRNIWVGEDVKLFTPEEAAKLDYSGSTALKWAAINGQVPERVVKATNGYFYPATINDIILFSKSSFVLGSLSP